MKRKWYVILDAEGNLLDDSEWKHGNFFYYRHDAVQYVMENGLLGCSVQVCQG